MSPGGVREEAGLFLKRTLEGPGRRDGEWPTYTSDRGTALLRGSPRVCARPSKPEAPQVPGPGEQPRAPLTAGKLGHACVPHPHRGPLFAPHALAQCSFFQEAVLASLPFPFLEFLESGPSEQHSSHFLVLCQGYRAGFSIRYQGSRKEEPV